MDSGSVWVRLLEVPGAHSSLRHAKHRPAADWEKAEHGAGEGRVRICMFMCVHACASVHVSVHASACARSAAGSWTAGMHRSV